MAKYKNVSNQSLFVMVMEKLRKKVVFVKAGEVFESDRETSHIQNLLRRKMIVKLD